MPEPDASREITLVRTFTAPRALLFQVLTEPDRLGNWWGPDGFVTTVEESDPRPGGALRLVMRGEDGVENRLAAVYVEVRAPVLLVVDAKTLSAGGETLLEARYSIELAEKDGQTELTLHASATALATEALDFLAGIRVGWGQSLQRLDDVLTGAEHRRILVGRLLRATPEQVFRLWTEREQVGKWWGPQGFSITIDEMDVRPGGSWRFTMHGPDGVDYPNHIIYDEVRAPERLVYTHEAPRFQSIVTLDEMAGMTVLSMRLVFPSVEERERTVEAYNAEQGVSESIDRLAALAERG